MIEPKPIPNCIKCGLSTQLNKSNNRRYFCARGMCRLCYGRWQSKEWYDKQSEENKLCKFSNNKVNNRLRRRKAIDKLGSVCACCGEDVYEFLAFDHINNDGAEDRRNGGVTSRVSSEVLSMPNPESKYQVLCWNCNACKYYWGKCVHQKSLMEL